MHKAAERGGCSQGGYNDDKGACHTLPSNGGTG